MPNVDAAKPHQGLATVQQAMNHLQVSRTTLWKMTSEGALPVKRLPGCRAIRIPWQSLNDLSKPD
jgi:excisionase family DNA binding protein